MQNNTLKSNGSSRFQSTVGVNSGADSLFSTNSIFKNSLQGPSPKMASRSTNWAGASLFKNIGSSISSEGLDLSDFPSLGGSGVNNSHFQNESLRDSFSHHPSNNAQASTRSPIPISHDLGSKSSENKNTTHSKSNGSVTSEAEQTSYASKASSGLRKQEDSQDQDFSYYGLDYLSSVVKKEDPIVNLLALGVDLKKLDLDTESRNLHQNFTSPWTENAPPPPNPPTDPPFTLPECYKMVNITSPAVKIPLFSDATLFYIFYNIPQDNLQELAAQHLLIRNWKYYIPFKLWFLPDAETDPIPRGNGFELTDCLIFDIKIWKTRTETFTVLPEYVLDRSNYHQPQYQYSGVQSNQFSNGTGIQAPSHPGGSGSSNYLSNQSLTPQEYQLQLQLLKQQQALHSTQFPPNLPQPQFQQGGLGGSQSMYMNNSINPSFSQSHIAGNHHLATDSSHISHTRSARDFQ